MYTHIDYNSLDNIRYSVVALITTCNYPVSSLPLTGMPHEGSDQLSFYPQHRAQSWAWGESTVCAQIGEEMAGRRKQPCMPLGPRGVFASLIFEDCPSWLQSLPWSSSLVQVRMDWGQQVGTDPTGPGEGEGPHWEIGMSPLSSFSGGCVALPKRVWALSNSGSENIHLSPPNRNLPFLGRSWD